MLAVARFSLEFWRRVGHLHPDRQHNCTDYGQICTLGTEHHCCMASGTLPSFVWLFLRENTASLRFVQEIPLRHCFLDSFPRHVTRLAIGMRKFISEGACGWNTSRKLRCYHPGYVRWRTARSICELHSEIDSPGICEEIRLHCTVSVKAYYSLRECKPFR